MEMMKSSKDHMEWLKNTTHSTGVIAQKAADHAAIFKSECQKLDRKCKSLSGFEQFLADIQGKLTQLEASADALMGVNEKDMKWYIHLESENEKEDQVIIELGQMSNCNKDQICESEKPSIWLYHDFPSFADLILVAI